MSSVSQQIAGTLQNDWGLAGTLAPTNMHFSVGWFDSQYMEYPQVTVRKAWTPEPTWFTPYNKTTLDALSYLSFPRYFVDCWLKSDHDILGEAEYETVEDMMIECFRIINLRREDFSPPLGLVIPLDHGEMMTESNRQPYILHIQMLVQANFRSGTP